MFLLRGSVPWKTHVFPSLWVTSQIRPNIWEMWPQKAALTFATAIVGVCGLQTEHTMFTFSQHNLETHFIAFQTQMEQLTSLCASCSQRFPQCDSVLVPEA